MDIESFKNALQLAGEAISVVKGAKDLMPSGPEKDTATQTLAEAEKAFRIAEAKAAQELGYELCQCTWPPQIMLLNSENGQFSCPVCDRNGGGRLIAAELIETEASAKQTDLSGDEHNILKLIFDLGDEGYEAEVIAEHLGMKVPKVDYYLERLRKGKYVAASYNAIEPTKYSLSQNGREFLIQSGDM